MTIVFVGDADSFWLKEYIERILDGTEHRIIIISNTNKTFKELYREKNIEVYTCRNEKRPRKLRKMLQWDRDGKAFFDEIGACDVLHIQYVSMEMLVKARRLMKNSKKVILTFWGSDLLRGNKKRYAFFRLFFRRAQIITVMTGAMKASFEAIYGNRFSSRIQVLDFGNPLYGALDFVEAKMDPGQCKAHWDIPPDKITVAVGYNAIPEQQHLKIMAQLVKLPRDILEQMVFVFHFGYGGQAQEYRRRLEKLLSDNRVAYRIIDRFLEKEETAILRLSVDIFVYGQTTDALSGSVLEYVYAGSTFVKAAWLDYSELDQRGIRYLEYRTFEELPGILAGCLGNARTAKDANKKDSRRKLREMNSWEVLAPEWRKMYQLEEDK